MMLQDSHLLILQGGLTITQTQRPVEIGAPDGNRTHVSRIASGVLSQLNYGTVRNLRMQIADAVLLPFRQSRMGKWRDRTEALHAGNRTRSVWIFTQDATPS